MAVTVTPKTLSSKTDDPAAAAAGEILPSEYNAGSDLKLTGPALVGKATAGNGAASEITLGTNLSFSGTTLNATGGGQSLVVVAYKADTYIGAHRTTSANAGLTANQLYACPITLPRSGTFTRIGCKVATAVASSQIRLGVYQDSNGQPGSLVFDAGVVDSSTTGLKEITISQVLSGTVWAVMVSGHAPTIAMQSAPNYALMGTDSGYFAFGYISRAFTMGSLPSDESAQTYTATISAAPIIHLRVA